MYVIFSLKISCKIGKNDKIAKAHSIYTHTHTNVHIVSSNYFFLHFIFIKRTDVYTLINLFSPYNIVYEFCMIIHNKFRYNNNLYCLIQLF